MAKIGLCWELGGGAGHLIRLAEIAELLIEQKHDVTLIVREQRLLSLFKVFAACTVVQAPAQRGFIKSNHVINYSALLEVCGFSNVGNLQTQLSAWRELFAQHRLEFLVVDHSPTAMLAAKINNIPTVMVGNGFSVPPSEKPMPSMRPWEDVKIDDLQKVDARVLHTINQSLLALGLEKMQLSSISELIDYADHWLIGISQLDHYLRGETTFVYPAHQQLADNPAVWPDLQGEKIFIYHNAESPQLANLLHQLSKTGLPVLAVIPDAPQKLVELLNDSNIRLSKAMVDIDSVISQCSTIICHGGAGTIKDFLLKGIPCITLPDVLERVLLSYRVAKAGLGFAGTPYVKNVDVIELINGSKKAQKVWENARHFSQKNALSQDHTVLADVLQQKLNELNLASIG